MRDNDIASDKSASPASLDLQASAAEASGPASADLSSVTYLQGAIGNSAVSEMLGNSGAQQNAPAAQAAPESVPMDLKYFQRRKREFVRWITQKKLPENVYRWDTRPPETIAQEGFKPWKPNGTISLIEHVKGALNGSGQAAKYESQWVSTGAYGMLKTLDPTMAQRIMSQYIYRIDPRSVSRQTDRDFFDVNAHFDAHDLDRPYATQREWATDGGIPAEGVVAFMDGRTYFDQLDLSDLAKGARAPEEHELQGWQAMPRSNAT